MKTDLDPLGSYLRNRRTRLDPATFGYSVEQNRRASPDYSGRQGV